MTDISNILLNAALPGAGLVADAVVPLAQRLGAQKPRGVSGTQSTQSKARPNPEFDAFYNEFIAWAADGPGKKAIVDYLKQYTNGAGEKIYHTTKYQQDVLAKLMERMKAEGLEGEDVYKELRKHFPRCRQRTCFSRSICRRCSRRKRTRTAGRMLTGNPLRGLANAADRHWNGSISRPARR